MMNWNQIKVLCLLAMIFVHVNQMRAQVYSESFGNETLPLTTDVGIYVWTMGDVPSDFTILDLDQGPILDFMSFMIGKPWKLILVENDTVAFSTSSYDVETQTNDWLITPKISLPPVAPGELLLLQWEGMSGDDFFKEDYSVKVSTVDVQPNNFTDLTSISGENGTNFEKRSVDVTSFAGKDVYFSFINTTYDGWLLYIDDIKVVKAQGFDVSLLQNTTKRFDRINENIDIQATLFNKGDYIHSLDVEWNDGTPHQATLSNLNIAPFSYYTLVHPTKFVKTVGGEYPISLKVTAINNGNNVDANLGDNQINFNVSVIENSARKNTLFELSTGTWCGYCPRGDVALKHLEGLHPDSTALGIKVHIFEDPIKNQEYEDGINLPGAPMLNVDRIIREGDVSNSHLEVMYNERSVLPSPLHIDASAYFEPISRKLKVDCSATFNVKYSDNLRFAAIVLEDSIHKDDHAYRQANNYADNALGPMGGYENLPPFVPAADMYYSRVPRALLGGYFGLPQSIPFVNEKNSTASYTFNYNIPSDYNAKHMNVIVLVLDEASGTVINAQKVGIEEVSGTSTPDKDQLVAKIYPSVVTNNLVTVEKNSNDGCRVQLFDVDGHLVQSGEISGRSSSFPIEATIKKGLYFMHVFNNKSAFVQKLIIN